MKTLSESNETAIVSGGTETARLTISANSKAFKELISGIYSDKAFAICRELFSNAVDSHTEAGYPDRQFDVLVPSVLEPSLSIRDYGVSMSHEMVMTVYSTLFESTKDDENDDTANNYTGKFGLGSKTPFAYTDAFQLTTYIDGTMRNYDIFLSDGIPTISMFMATETDEPNGVLVSFPVETNDHKDFRRATKKACQGLDVLPNFVNSSFTVELEEPSFEGENWKMYRSEASYHYRNESEKLRVRQGTVIYPLNEDAITVPLTKESEKLFSMNLVVTVPIGTLEVNTAREALSYDDRTSQNIVDALDGIFPDIKEVLTAGRKDIKSFSEFCIWSNEQSNKTDGHIFDAIFRNLKFKGKKAQHRLFTKILKETVENDAGIKRMQYKGGMELCYFNRNDQGLKTMVFKSDRNMSMNHGFRVATGGTLSIPLDAKLVVVYENLDDNVSLQSSKIKRLSTELSDDSVILWMKGGNDPLREIVRIAYGLGYPHMTVINMNTLERMPRVVSKSATEKPSDFYRPYRHGNWRHPDFTAEAPEKAYYVDLFRKDPVLKRGFRMYALSEAYDLLCDAGIMEKIPVVGVPVSEKAKMRHFPQWENFEDVVLAHAPSAPKAEDVYAMSMKRLLSERLRDSAQGKLLTLLKDCSKEYEYWRSSRWWKENENLHIRWKLKQAAKRTDLWEFYSEYRRWDALTDEGLFKTDIGRIAEIVSPEEMIAKFPEAVKQAETDTARYRKLYREFNKEYGLLKHIDINQESRSDIRRYLKLID